MSLMRLLVACLNLVRSVLQVILQFIIPKPVIHNSAEIRLRDSRHTAQVIRKFETKYGNVHLDFFQGNLSQACNQAKNDICFLMENGVMVWIGNVKDPEAYEASSKLRATTYPFIAFLVLQSSNGNSGSMTMVDRIEGFETPENIIVRLTNQINRHETNLYTMRHEMEERKSSRQIREQQDMAYQLSLLADQEKERKVNELAEAKRLAEENAKKEEIKQKKNEKKKLEWRFWALSTLSDEPPETDKNITRLSFRLPNGERIIRRFKLDDTVEMVYIFVDTYFLREKHSFSSNLQSPPKDYTHKFDFLLISPFPRTEYPVDKYKAIKNEKGLCSSANLIVESIS